MMPIAVKGAHVHQEHGRALWKTRGRWHAAGEGAGAHSTATTTRPVTFDATHSAAVRTAAAVATAAATTAATTATTAATAAAAAATTAATTAAAAAAATGGIRPTILRRGARVRAESAALGQRGGSSLVGDRHVIER